MIYAAPPLRTTPCNPVATAARRKGAGADRRRKGVHRKSRLPDVHLFFRYRGQSIAALLAPYIAEQVLGERPRILDVGAGFGHILHAFGDRFADADRFTIEISRVCVDHLRSLGFTVYQQSTEQVLTTLDERFDVLILSHVLAHLRRGGDRV